MFTDNPAANLFIWAAIVYLIPTWLALLGRHRNCVAIFMLNLLAGWTLVGWFSAFIWSLTRSPRPAR